MTIYKNIYFPGGGVPPTYQRLSYLLGVQVCPKIAFFAIFTGAAWAGAGAKKGGGASGGPLLGGGVPPLFPTSAGRCDLIKPTAAERARNCRAVAAWARY